MAKASFFVNHITVRKKGEFLVIEAKKMCQHGTVFDEVFLTLPGEMDCYFTQIESAQADPPAGHPKNQGPAERFRRYMSDN